jgi:hypothetical protein
MECGPMNLEDGDVNFANHCEFLLKAVNSHDDLVAALQDSDNLIRALTMETQTISAGRVIAANRAALEKAGVR